MTQRTKGGKVYLVGAGPGDPGLITLRGLECLDQADVVIYDSLVNPVLLANLPDRVELIAIGGHASARQLSQREVNRLLVDKASQGAQVVRLKGGDPGVFGRCAEEVDALREAGIAFEIVPGVTAALGAAAYAEIPITRAGSASAVAIVTGHQRTDPPEAPLDYAGLARFPGTLVFYMGVTTARQWSEALLAGGRAADTPVAIVRRCTRSGQETVFCTLETVAQRIEELRVRPPAVIIVGEVVAHAPPVSWFARLPLLGTTVMITRPRQQCTELARRFCKLGADVLIEPAIRIEPPDDWTAVDRRLEELDRFDWIVFTSVNGVQFFLDRLLAKLGDLRRLGSAKLAAIGPGTAGRLAQFHLRADLVPDTYRAEALAEKLAGAAPGRRVLIARASRGRPVLVDRLEQAGCDVVQLAVYQSTDVPQPTTEAAELLAAGRITWITVTSPAIAESLVRLFGQRLRKAKLASISPVTSQVLRDCGLEPAVEAVHYTLDGVVQAILGATQ